MKKKQYKLRLSAESSRQIHRERELHCSHLIYYTYWYIQKYHVVFSEINMLAYIYSQSSCCSLERKSPKGLFTTNDLPSPVVLYPLPMVGALECFPNCRYRDPSPSRTRLPGWPLRASSSANRVSRPLQPLMYLSWRMCIWWFEQTKTKKFYSGCTENVAPSIAVWWVM